MNNKNKISYFELLKISRNNDTINNNTNVMINNNITNDNNTNAMKNNNISNDNNTNVMINNNNNDNNIINNNDNNIFKKSIPQKLEKTKTQLTLYLIYQFRKVQNEIYNLIISNPNKNYKIMAACGTGKTITFKRIINKIQNYFEHIIILVPSIILAEQTIYKTFEIKQSEELPIIKINAYYSENNLNNNSNITICVNNSIVKTLYYVCKSLKLNVKQYDKNNEDALFNDYYSKLKSHNILFVIDEAHHVFNVSCHNISNFTEDYENTFYNKIRQIVLNTSHELNVNNNNTNVMRNNDNLLNNFTYYAFTATFESKPDYKYPLSKAINDKILVPYELDIVNICEDTLEERFSKLIQILKNDKYKRILIYVNKIRLAQLLSFYLCLISIDYKSNPHNITNVEFSEFNNSCNISKKDFKIHANAEYIVDTDSRKKRDEIFEKLKIGEIRIIISVNCIAEGVDLPFVDTVIMLNDRESEIQTIQIIGRALRTYSEDSINKDSENPTNTNSKNQNSKQIGYVILFSTPNYSSTKLQNTLSILLKYDNELYKRKIQSIQINSNKDINCLDNSNELLNLNDILIVFIKNKK